MGEALAGIDESKAPLYESLLRNHVAPLAAKALAVKILNLFLSQYHFRARDTRLLSSPYGIVVDPINNCQLACPGCVHSANSVQRRLFDWPSGMLSESTFADFMRQYGPNAVEIVFHNYGEPLLNPSTPGLIRVAKTYLARTSLSSNMAMKRFAPEAYVNSGLDSMTVSIDGATQETYERFRHKGDLATVLGNVRGLLRARSRLGKRTPVVSWQYLAFEHNEHEIGAAIGMARRLGVNQFTLVAPFDVSWDDPGIRASQRSPRVIPFRSDIGRRLADNWNPFAAEIEAAPIEREFSVPWRERSAGGPAPGGASARARTGPTCRYLYANIVMDAKGRILPCCASPGPGKNLVFGVAGPGGDHFNSEKYRLARLSFATPESSRSEMATASPGSAPHCAVCDWLGNRSNASVDRDRVKCYFSSAGRGVFNRACVAALGSR